MNIVLECLFDFLRSLVIVIVLLGGIIALIWAAILVDLWLYNRRAPVLIKLVPVTKLEDRYKVDWSNELIAEVREDYEVVSGSKPRSYLEPQNELDRLAEAFYVLDLFRDSSPDAVRAAHATLFTQYHPALDEQGKGNLVMLEKIESAFEEIMLSRRKIPSASKNRKGSPQ